MKVNRKVVGLGVLLSGSALFLAACAGGGGDSGSSEGAEGGGATLTVWVDQNRADALKDVRNAEIKLQQERNDLRRDAYELVELRVLAELMEGYLALATRVPRRRLGTLLQALRRHAPSAAMEVRLTSAAGTRH